MEVSHSPLSRRSKLFSLSHTTFNYKGCDEDDETLTVVLLYFVSIVCILIIINTKFYMFNQKHTSYWIWF